MRVANFRDDVIYAIAEELDIDVDSIDFTKERARQYTDFANKEVRRVWPLADWPELDVTEERAFATIYADWKTFLRQNDNGQPDILFYIPTVSYFQVKTDAPADPPPGTLPTDTDYFDPITLEDRYIDYDQACRRAIGMVLGIYPSNPRLNGAGRTRIPYRPSEKGIDVRTALNTVFIRFQIRPSKFTSKLYVDGAHKKGEIVYFDSGANPGFDGQCFRALADTNNIAPTNTEFWALVPMPEILTPYVVYRAAGKAAPDQVKKQELYTLADEALDDAITKLHNQGVRFPRYSLARPGSSWPFGLSGGYCLGIDYSATSEVTTLTDVCEDEGGGSVPTATQAQGEFYDPTINGLRAPATKPLSTYDTRHLATGTKLNIIFDPGTGWEEAQSFKLKVGAADATDPTGQVDAFNSHGGPARYWQKVG